MDKLHAYREVFHDLPAGCTAAEVNLICKDNTEVTCSEGKVIECTASERNMLFVRATGKTTGIVYCENLEEDPRKLIAMALENASVVASGKPQPMLENACERHVMEEKQLPTTEDLIAKAKEVSRLPGVQQCTVSACIRHSIVLNSLGTETEQRQPVYMISIDVLGKGEDNFKTKSRSSKNLDEIDVQEMMRQLEEESLLEHEELPYIALPAGTYDAVLSSAMMVNIMNTAWQLLAQRLIDTGRSPLQKGDVLGSDKLNIMDCPVAPWSGYDYTIDGEGVRGPEETCLVDAGAVTDTLRTLKQEDSTGCAGRADLLTANINTELISVPRNIWIRPGEQTPEELIQQMKTGIHLTYSMDEFHSLNISRASFSIPCGGVYYEDGKAVGRLQQMNICGSFKDLFAGLEAVGNDMNMRPMWPHNDYCFGGPSLLVRGANFAM